MTHKANMVMIDRTFRLMIGDLLIYIGFINKGIIAGETLKYIPGAIGVINITSSVAGICPIYLCEYTHASPNFKLVR